MKGKELIQEYVHRFAPIRTDFSSLKSLIDNGLGYKLFVKYDRIANKTMQEYTKACEIQTFHPTKVFDDYYSHKLRGKGKVSPTHYL